MILITCMLWPHITPVSNLGTFWHRSQTRNLSDRKVSINSCLELLVLTIWAEMEKLCNFFFLVEANRTSHRLLLMNEIILKVEKTKFITTNVTYVISNRVQAISGLFKLHVCWSLQLSWQTCLFCQNAIICQFQNVFIIHS
jgi:hypothetical protein